MRLITVIAFLLCAAAVVAQTKSLTRKAYFKNSGTTTATEKAEPTDTVALALGVAQGEDEEELEPPINKGFGFGVSLGYNRISKELYDAHLSPVDNTLKISEVSKTSFLLSTTVSAPLQWLIRKENKKAAEEIRKTEKVYQAEVDGEPVGHAYYIPKGLYLVATVNLLNFSEAAKGSIFNKKIDGGLGLGYRFNDDVLIALTYEMMSVRQPRDFLINEFRDQQVTVNNELITELNGDDNRFFSDKYLASFSLKLVYLIRGNKVKED